MIARLYKCFVLSAKLSLVSLVAPAVVFAQSVPETAKDIQPTINLLLEPDNSHLLLAPEKLHVAGLDYTLKSLHHIDAWLLHLHHLNVQESGRKGEAGSTLKNDERGYYSILLAGLYLGEVVRRNQKHVWHWENFNTFITNNPIFTGHYSTDPGFDTVILANQDGSATPINSALKRVLFGPEESLHYVANFLTTSNGVRRNNLNATKKTQNNKTAPTPETQYMRLSGGNSQQETDPPAPKSTRYAYQYIAPMAPPQIVQNVWRPDYLPDPNQSVETHPSHRNNSSAPAKKDNPSLRLRSRSGSTAPKSAHPVPKTLPPHPSHSADLPLGDTVNLAQVSPPHVQVSQRHPTQSSPNPNHIAENWFSR